MNKYNVSNINRNTGVIVIGGETGDIKNQTSSLLVEDIDWVALKKECEILILKSSKEEMRACALEINDNLSSKKLDNIIPTLKKMGKKGLDIAESLGCNVIANLISTYVMTK